MPSWRNIPIFVNDLKNAQEKTINFGCSGRYCIKVKAVNVQTYILKIKSEKGKPIVINNKINNNIWTLTEFFWSRTFEMSDIFLGPDRFKPLNR